ncbi:SRPBCC family protein [Sphingobium tyrosinilyticum]|uniref:SRPBCC family protein n=1 Tax=Sphingobium tyrosinilyticum TaxID=2715436 RepID=A0ABV9F109_9SPHN
MTITLDATIDAPLDHLWSMIADFPNLMRWHPGVERCETLGVGVGAVRRLYFADFWAAEKLELLDNDQHILRYAIIDGSNPASKGLRGTISLSAGDEGQTNLTWTSGVDPDREDAAFLDAYLQTYYPERIEHLRQAVTSPRA